MRKRNQQFDVFCEVATLLNGEIGSVPILYGSLGLSQYLPDIEANDIDLLIEQSIYDQVAKMLPPLLLRIGFMLIDTSELEFGRNACRVGIAPDGDLLAFAGIDPVSLEVIDQPCRYRILGLPDYLAAYQASSQDGYRKNVRQKGDAHKLQLIREALRTP